MYRKGRGRTLGTGFCLPCACDEAGALSWWKEAEAKFALEHEYIHMRRFDAAFKFALALALTIHWFNPTVWLFYILANRDMELSCDEAALYRLGGENRGTYAHALLAAEERRAEISVPYAGFGVNMTKERIVEIMNYRKKSPFCIVIAVLLTLALAACAATGSETQGVQIAGESLDVNGVALRPDGEAARIYENGGMRLLVPLEYDALLVVDIPQDNEEGYFMFRDGYLMWYDEKEPQAADCRFVRVE